MIDEQMNEAAPLRQQIASIGAEDMPSMLACHMVGDAEDIAWETLPADSDSHSHSDSDEPGPDPEASPAGAVPEDAALESAASGPDEADSPNLAPPSDSVAMEDLPSTPDQTSDLALASEDAAFASADAAFASEDAAFVSADAAFVSEDDYDYEPQLYSMATPLSFTDGFPGESPDGWIDPASADGPGSETAYSLLAGSLHGSASAPQPATAVVQHEAEDQSEDQSEALSSDAGSGLLDPPLDAAPDALLESDLQDEAEGWHLPHPDLPPQAVTADSVSDDSTAQASDGKEAAASATGRQHERYTVDGHAEVTVTAAGQSSLLLRGRILDISPSGCFVQTLARTEIAPGTAVDILFAVAREVFRVKAETRFAKSRIGIGFRFLPMPENTRARLLTALDRVATNLRKQQEANRDKQRAATNPVPLDEYVAATPNHSTSKSPPKLVEGEVIQAAQAEQHDSPAPDPPLAWNPFEIGRRPSR